ncbi:MAG: PIN domain-containing protein, partial [Bacteroidota bacterium]
KKIEEKYQLFTGDNTLIVSVVTLGELKSIERQFKYGAKKKAKIKSLLENLLKIDLNIEEIIERYAEIDAFSQGKHDLKKSNFTSRNMGKNDLWIAATASVYDAILITTDKDFIHLDKEFLQLECIDLEEFKT